MASIFDGRTVLILGGTGSLGQAISGKLLSGRPHAIRIYSRDEVKQSEMRERFGDKRLRFLIGDVRDKERLHRAMNDVDIVIFAAALKQVPSCESNPMECIKTNVGGAMNVIDCALDSKVQKVVAISTDKSVEPWNLYGASKMCMEKLFIHSNTYSGNIGTRFCCVRYGNVSRSRGSVIPLFERQRASGTLTLTDQRMTRFFFSISEAVEFLVGCCDRMQGGETFVAKMKAKKIVDLAREIGPDCKFEFTGIRPGEKIHEVLITADEARRTKDMGSYYVIEPQNPSWTYRGHLGLALNDGFEYSSDRCLG